eukprot:371504_1
MGDFAGLNKEELSEIAVEAKMKNLHKIKFIKGVKELQSTEQEKTQQISNISVAKNNYQLDDMKEEESIRFDFEQANINNEINETLYEQYVPLHHFNSQNIASKIKWWLYNDINYKKNLFKTINIFVKHSLYGRTMDHLTTDHVKRIAQSDLSEFMTTDTMDIMFKCFAIDKHKFTNMTAPQIARTMYHYPLNSLTNTILSENINGKRFIDRFEQNDEFIKNSTGYDSNEIHQLNAILLKHSTPTQNEFIENMINNMNKTLLPDTVKQQLQNAISNFDVEKLHYKMRYGKDIQEFSDMIINKVDDLQYEVQNNENDFIKEIYEIIGSCFTFPNVSIKQEWNQWICQNCSNHNFNRYIGSKLCYDLSICSLCGIQQIDSVVIKLKNYDTFTMVNDDNINDNDEKKRDDIDDLIQTALNNEPLDLSCPNQSDHSTCPSLIRLAKRLIEYKRWLSIVYHNAKGNACEIVTDHDIEKVIDNDTYKDIFIKCAENINKVTDDQLQLIKAMIQNNTENIAICQVFMNFKRAAFSKLMKKYCKIKLATGTQLYKKIKHSITKKAQICQFGQFLVDLDMNAINKDYHHILKLHINHGNKITIKNSLRFFQRVVHYEDTYSDDVDECRSCKRRQQRVNALNSTENKREIADEKKDISPYNSEDKNIGLLNQSYMETQLDIIHSYLVHSDWKLFVQRFSNKHDNDDECEYETDTIGTVNETDVWNK